MAAAQKIHEVSCRIEAFILINAHFSSLIVNVAMFYLESVAPGDSETYLLLEARLVLSRPSGICILGPTRGLLSIEDLRHKGGLVQFLLFADLKALQAVK